MNTPSLDDIGKVLLALYRDLAEPWYGWVLPAYEADPYRTVRDALAALGASVEDGTDLNDDVSCHYLVRRGGRLVVAELSLAGPYAVVLDGKAVDGAPAPELVEDITQTLQAHGLLLLDADMLRIPVGMLFENVEAGQGTLYQALFADTPSPFEVAGP